MRDRFDVNFFDGSYVNDPYPVYEEIRAVGRVVWNDALNGWMIPGFSDCTRVLTDKGVRFGSANGDPEKIFWFDAANMIMVDGDQHTRLRSHLAPVFTRSAVAKWEQRVGQVVDDLLRPLVERSGGFELIADFTMIPTIIIADMLGIPEERYPDFRRWSHNITSNLSYGLDDAKVYEMLLQTGQELNSYMRSEVERRRSEPSDDLLTALLQSSMTDEEIVSTGFLLLVAGYDTTAKTMSNCVVALEQHPEQRKLLVENPSLIPAAIEEVMRWWGLLQMQPRIAVKDTELAGPRSARATTCIACWQPPTAIPSAGPTLSSSTSRGNRSPTWASGTERISASALLWPASRSRSRWSTCWSSPLSTVCGTSISETRG